MSGRAPLRFRRGEGTALYVGAGVMLGLLFVWLPEPVFAAWLAVWAAAGLTQLLWAHYSLRRISVRFLPPPRAFRAGQALVLQAELRNQSGWFRHAPVALAPLRSDRAEELPPQAVTRLPRPGRAELVVVDYGVAERGRPLVALGRVVTQRPFGLFRAERALELSLRLIVWPHRQQNLPSVFAPPGRRMTRGRVVASSGRRLTTSAERERTRAYQPGDPARAIHWKLSARLGELIVVDTRGPPVTRFWLQLETIGAAWIGRAQFECALRMLATLAEDGFASGRLHGVILNGRARPLGDRHALLALLDQLAGLPVPVASGFSPRGPRADAARGLPRRDVLRLVPAPDGGVSLVDARGEVLCNVSAAGESAPAPAP